MGVNDPEAELKHLMLCGLNGDAVAWRTLLRALRTPLRGYFTRRLFDGAADAEDLVQDTLIAIHAKRGTWDPTQPFTNWLYAVARYKLIDHLRRQGRRSTVPIEEAAAIFAGSDVEEALARRDLTRALAILPARQRRLIEDVRITGLTIAEAAARHGFTAGAAKVSLHRALKTVSAHVGARSEEADREDG